MENNKLIAEFIGFKPCLVADSDGNKIYVGKETPFGWKYPDCYPEADYLISVQDLKFNTSWDWLMPVIQNIEQYCEGVPQEMINISLYSDINEVYKSVVEFIKNQNN